MANALEQSDRIPQSVSGAGDGTSTAAYPSDVVSGNLLVAAIAWDANARSITSITDTRGSIWSAATAQSNRPTDRSIQLWRAIAGGDGPNTITVHWDLASTMSVVHDIAEYSGASEQDGSGVADNGLIQNPSIDLSVGTNGDLVVGAILASSFQPDAGATFTREEFGSFAFYDAYEDNLNASAGTLAVAFTTDGAVGYAIVAAAFGAASGPALVDYIPGVVTANPNSGWTDQDDSSDPADIVAAFEAVRDDNTYVKSPLNPTSSDRLILELRAVVGGGAMQTPVAGTDHTLMFTLCADGVLNGTVELHAGDDELIKAWTFVPIAENTVAGTPEFDVTGTLTLNGTETTDWLAHGYEGSTLQFVPASP